MFKTRKQLKKRILDLEKELKVAKHHNLRSALVEKADLPKCKSVACYNCKYVTFLYHPENGAMYLLGCGKDLTCNDFVYTDKNKPPIFDREEELLTMVSISTECQEHCQSGPCLQIPRPPCHIE